MQSIAGKERKFNKIITAVSIVIPVVVAFLFGVKLPNVAPLTFLPPIYATINGVTAVLLVVAVITIKNGQQKVHQNIMSTCVALSVVFLVMYIAYHMTSDATKFGGVGAVKYVYYTILVSHIILSIALIPLVLRTYAKAYLKDFKAHKAIAKYTFPIWLYVATTGVVVYLMISPYYTS